MAPADLPYLQHMLDAVDRLQRYVRDQDRDGFEADEVIQDAVIRQLEILGEAASRVTPEFRDSVSEIPWAKVIGTRHRLIHGYLSVDLEIVWHTATHHVPRLRSDLENAIRGLVD